MKKLIESIQNFWWLYVIAILILGFIVNTVFISYKLEKARDTIQIQNVQLSAIKDSVFSYRLKTGEMISKINSVQVEKDNLKDALETAGFDLKELKNENVKLRKINLALKAEIKAIGEVNTTVKDTFETTTITDIETGKTTVDTTYFTKVNDWSNNHLSIYNGTIRNKDLNFNYAYKVGFQFVLDDRKKQSTVTIKLDDPKAKITTANSITIDKTKRWYEKWWFWTAVGATGGILIAK